MVATQTILSERYAIILDYGSQEVISYKFELIDQLLSKLMSDVDLKLYRTQYEEPSLLYLNRLTQNLFIG